MIYKRIARGGCPLACIFILCAASAFAKTADYRFELVGKPQLTGHTELVQIRLVRVVDGEAVADAVIFESTADMGPAGMDAMGAPVKPMPVHGAIYSFTVAPSMTGTWAIHLAAKVQGERETIRGSVTVDLVS